MIERFWDPDWEVFFDTSLEHTRLLVRPRDVLDNALPSGGASAAMALLRLSVFTGLPGYAAKAEASMKSLLPHMEQSPSAVTSWLAAVDFLTASRQEVVVIGGQEDPTVADMLREVRGRFAPNTVLGGAHAQPGNTEKTPLLQGRGLTDGKATAYVCESYVCGLPVTSAADLAAQLT
ncbi:MAG: hypothetical protein QF357_08840 [Dehalococcoidia bacterium]|jgi:hypothetical protein|nr:hypothetical protein [Dehalococcoidia bacterium]